MNQAVASVQTSTVLNSLEVCPSANGASAQPPLYVLDLSRWARAASRWFSRLFVAAAVSAAFIVAASAQAERRVALVIGNSAYQHSAPLGNPTNDAQDLADTLGRLGFEVILEKDLDKRGMEQSFSHFARLAQDADVAVFYYAGHAMQYDGENFLVPIDAALQDEFSVEFEMARVSDVLNSLERARGVKILILDACRNNPLAEQLARQATNRTLFASRGLARIEHPSGMVIAYATQAGQVADDGRGRNSPFTSALIRRIEEPGVEIAQIFRRVAVDVNSLTKGRQVPDLSMSLLGEVYLSNPVVSKVNIESEAWQKIATSKERSDFERFVGDFPDSPFSDIAKERIRILESKRVQDESADLAFQSAKEQAARAGEREEAVRIQAPRIQAARVQANDEEAVKDESLRQQSATTAVEKETAGHAVASGLPEQVEQPSAQVEKLLQPETIVKPDAKVTSTAAIGDSTRDLAKSIAQELRRVGCYRGSDSESWQTGPETGLEQYLRVTKLNVPANQPSTQILNILKIQSGQVCSLSCKAGETLIRGNCISKTCPASMALSTAGNCVAAHARETTASRKPERAASRSLSRRDESRQAPPRSHHTVYGNPVVADDPPPQRTVVSTPPRFIAPAPLPIGLMPHLCLGVGPLAVCR
jgi:hypothetical protein